MLGKLRKKYEEAMLPVGKMIGRSGLSPNSLSLLSVAAAGLAGWYFLGRDLLLGVLCVILSGGLDAIDGSVARSTGKASNFGTVMDHVLDRYAEFLIVCGIVWGGYVGWFWGIFCLFGMVMASFTRAKAESVGKVDSCIVGVAERQEKLLILIAGGIGSIYYQGALELASIVVGVLSHVTVVQRLDYTRKKARG